MGDEFSGGIDDDHLAPGPETGIDPKDRHVVRGWGEKKLTEVAGEYVDRISFGDLPQSGQDFGRQRGL